MDTAIAYGALCGLLASLASATVLGIHIRLAGKRMTPEKEARAVAASMAATVAAAAAAGAILHGASGSAAAVAGAAPALAAGTRDILLARSFFGGRIRPADARSGRPRG